MSAAIISIPKMSTLKCTIMEINFVLRNQFCTKSKQFMTVDNVRIVCLEITLYKRYKGKVHID